MASACYISSYAYEPPHTKTPWYAKAKEEDKRVFDRLRLLANFRASQTGNKKSVEELSSCDVDYQIPQRAHLQSIARQNRIITVLRILYRSHDETDV